MLILHNIGQLAEIKKPLSLAAGVFDGVHLGHRAVIDAAKKSSEATGGIAGVLTFDPHPLRVLRPDRAPHLITSTQHKIRLLNASGVDHLLLLRFDQEIAATPPEEFISSVVRHAPDLRRICVGMEWAFGRNRAGNLQLLQALGAQYGFDVTGVEPVKIDGVTVSSTAIRAAIQQGDLAAAERFLGRPFTILGTVIEGQQLGQKLGFPTANLSTHNEQFPPDGVYAVRAWHKTTRHDGVVNIGYRPTVSSTDLQRLLELHLFEFNQSIYGDEIEVEFIQYIRPEQRFANLDELKKQIALDAAQARRLLGEHPG